MLGISTGAGVFELIEGHSSAFIDAPFYPQLPQKLLAQIRNSSNFISDKYCHPFLKWVLA